MGTAKYMNYLSISQRGKGIPYGGTGVLREDGDTNYGFKYLKGNEPGLRQVPELIKDPALLELALAINHPESGLFTVGCVSGQSKDPNGFPDCGYMEFAINSRSAIADATSYFPIFSNLIASCMNQSFQYPRDSNGSFRVQRSQNATLPQGSFAVSL